MNALNSNSSYINNIFQQASVQAADATHTTSAKKPASMEEIKKAAKDFEAVFINETLRLLFQDVNADPMFGSSNCDEIYRDMLLDQFGTKISDAGGFGIAPHIEAELLKLQEA